MRACMGDTYLLDKYAPWSICGPSIVSLGPMAGKIIIWTDKVDVFYTKVTN
jgi:hypothetical protein